MPLLLIIPHSIRMTVLKIGSNDTLNCVIATIQRLSNIWYRDLEYSVGINYFDPILVSQENLGLLPIFKHSRCLIGVLINFESHCLYAFLNSLTLVWHLIEKLGALFLSNFLFFHRTLLTPLWWSHLHQTFITVHMITLFLILFYHFQYFDKIVLLKHKWKLSIFYK